ncbi:GNAT family N-acetyltransferase [cf. Phormidesmis sp. LEGE 11477]|uniref:GNAT family N-acetyltransferase n=1 Tax=cf. Phormidesmis sp. LEGE 11477 TaxID=1828680 RepID=UPI00188288DA|nr:GNAT family N-acetyltransferase [cf. Phormidesmis sp. LEGE 11477]MBE9059452.1 GNAT family N-acetyltransferase [cf. Phormidesmis sp. LEGE 11477]
MSNYIVRLAKEADLVHIPVIEARAARQFEPYATELEISVDLLSGLTPMTFLKRAQAEKRIWVAAIEAQPVGFIVAKFLLESCFIVELDVLPDYGRRGIGSALIEACCEGARLRNHTQITLTTFRYVPWNIPFYRQCGFEILPPERCSRELKAIVEHEARYGFVQKHRVVMRRLLSKRAERRE